MLVSGSVTGPGRTHSRGSSCKRQGRVLVSFFFLCFGTAGAAAAEYSSRTWQTDAGLPSRTVQAIAQTRDGYLWVGTQSGLARFDGIDFTVFNPEKVKTIKDANILGLRESRDGSLWIATGAGGVLRLKGGKFVHYGKAEGLASDYMMGPILETAEGAVWFGTVAGLSRFADGKFTSFTVTNGLSNNIIRDLCEDREGNLWIATVGGLDCWAKGGGLRHLALALEFKGAQVKSICCDREGTIWFGDGNKLDCLRGGQLTSFSQQQAPPCNIITRLYVDCHGNFWVGSHGGLSRFVNGQFVPQVGSDGLAFDQVTSICEDQEQNLWVGSKDGLTQLQAKRFTTYAHRQGLANNNVMSILEDRQGTMWVGTWGGGLNQILEGSLTACTNFTHMPLLALALHEDRSGRLWAGSDFDGGLYRLGGKAIHHFDAAHGLPDSAIRVIYEDAQSNLWVGTSSGLYKANGSRFSPFGVEHGLGPIVVRAIHQDRAGNLWVGTQEGLWQFSPGRVLRYTRSNGLSDNAVIALYEDNPGALWIGTAGGGLNRLSNGTMATFTTDQGLFNNVICEILEDGQGWLWLSCPRGIFRIPRQDLERVAQGSASRVISVVYGQSDGMLSELCNGVTKPGAWKARDGRLWFATSKGVCVIDPAVQTNNHCCPPAVVLERVLADKQLFPAEETLPVTGLIQVPPGRGELEFHYAALSFRAPERNRFKYRLEGVDADWIEAGSRHVAYYHQIRPGKYRFRISARSNNTDWNETGAQVEIVLLPHVWETWWFRPALAGAVGLLGLGLHWLRLARLRDLQRLRLRLAADLHDEVGSNLSTISLLSRRAQKESPTGHQGKDDLAAISCISHQTANAVREIVWLINPEYDTLQDLVLRMKDTARETLAGIEYNFYAPPAAPSAKLSPQFRQDFFLLYKETLTNVARHSCATRVEIDVAQPDGAWEFTVRDNGIGFAPAAAHAGNGLKNLRRRAAKLKGTLNLKSRPGSGTTVSFSLKHF